MFPVQAPHEEKAASAVRNNNLQKRLKQQLELLDSMPDDAAIDIHVLCALKSRSPASVWRDVKAGRLAPPFKAGPRSTRWRLGDVRAPIVGYTSDAKGE